LSIFFPLATVPPTGTFPPVATGAGRRGGIIVLLEFASGTESPRGLWRNDVPWGCCRDVWGEANERRRAG
jgi:hypothetical protein